jgi:hypothetical protein
VRCVLRTNITTPLPIRVGVRDYKRTGTAAQADSNESFRSIVDNWLTDVKRRGAELYATNEGDEVQYFSFEGKNHFRFSLKIDYALQEIAVQITDPTSGGTEVENLALTAKNLDALARLMCSVKEGEAIVPVYLLAQLAVICHGYQRLVQELDKIHGIETTTGSVTDIETDLRRFLTPEEQKRTDNPLLTQKGRK